MIFPSRSAIAVIHPSGADFLSKSLMALAQIVMRKANSVPSTPFEMPTIQRPLTEPTNASEISIRRVIRARAAEFVSTAPGISVPKGCPVFRSIFKERSKMTTLPSAGSITERAC